MGGLPARYGPTGPLRAAQRLLEVLGFIMAERLRLGDRRGSSRRKRHRSSGDEPASITKRTGPPSMAAIINATDAGSENCASGAATNSASHLE